jgi:hypothetical protein
MLSNGTLEVEFSALFWVGLISDVVDEGAKIVLAWLFLPTSRRLREFGLKKDTGVTCYIVHPEVTERTSASNSDPTTGGDDGNKLKPIFAKLLD